MRVTLTFPQHVHVHAVYDAAMQRSLTTSNSVTVELGPTPTATSEFAVMGTGSEVGTQVDLTGITFACKPVEGPPPAPPHPNDCPLVTRYKIKNAWINGEIVVLRLNGWEPGRKFTLTYWGQHVTVSSPQGGSLIDASPDAAGNTIVKLSLSADQPFVSGSADLAGDDDADGATYDVVFQVSPPARCARVAVCAFATALVGAHFGPRACTRMPCSSSCRRSTVDHL